MKILLRKVLIADPGSVLNGLQKDILIDGNLISAIEDHISQASDIEQIIEAEGLTVSPGWVDSFSHFCDPGL